MLLIHSLALLKSNTALRVACVPSGWRPAPQDRFRLGGSAAREWGELAKIAHRAACAVLSLIFHQPLSASLCSPIWMTVTRSWSILGAARRTVSCSSS